MPKGSPTAIFVSSTCYDLSQIRADLRLFSSLIGLEAVMSEFDSFPIDPNQDTVTNCLDAVRHRADIFVLVIGGRYGSMNETGKSITNLEFLEATSKGIPKYVFVNRQILTLLPIWKDNKNGDYSSVVDTPKLFEFVSHLRDSGQTWVFPFDTAQDITNTLTKQFSYLLSECLDLKLKFQDFKFSHLQLKPNALRLILEKPKGWEYLLFATVLKDQIDGFKYARLDAELGISFGNNKRIDDVSEIIKWALDKLSAISKIIEHLTKALNNGFIKAVGEPGEPGDTDRIVHLAWRIGDAYEQLLKWTLEFNTIEVEEEFKYLLLLLSKMSINAVNEIEEYSNGLYEKIKEILANEEKYENGTIITLTLTAPIMGDEFHNETERLIKLYSFKFANL